MSQASNIYEYMKQLLAQMDITEYEPAVPHMLVELFYRHVSEILTEAKECSIHKAKSGEIEEEDLKFATSIVIRQNMAQNSSIQSLSKIAAKINSIPLPPIPDIPELVLPPEEISLLEANYQIGQPSGKN